MDNIQGILTRCRSTRHGPHRPGLSRVAEWPCSVCLLPVGDPACGERPIGRSPDVLGVQRSSAVMVDTVVPKTRMDWLTYSTTTRQAGQTTRY
jgi:hypothetical protein